MEEKKTLMDLLDKPEDLKVEDLPVPSGVSKKIIEAIKEPVVDDGVYSYNELAEKVKSMPPVPKISSGHDCMDETVDGGFHGGELIVLSGPTKSGKTSFTQSMSYFQAIKNIPSLWFTLEMSWQELTRKFMLMEESSFSGSLTLPIFYPIDNRNISLEWLEKQIVYAQKNQGVKMVYIDHLHFLLSLSETTGSNASFLVGGIVRALKQMAVRLDIPILLIAHTKKIDTDKIPDMNSPRDSSFVVQESDFTFIIFREREKVSSTKQKDFDIMNSENIYTDRTIVSLEAARRGSGSKRMAFGMFNNLFYPYQEYLSIKSQSENEEILSNIDSNDGRLEEARDKIND